MRRRILVTILVAVGLLAVAVPVLADPGSATVSLVAPQMPRSCLPTRRQGPIEQFLQQAPSCPMGQGFIASAREKAVEIPSASAIPSIASTAGSMVLLSVIVMFLSNI